MFAAQAWDWMFPLGDPPNYEPARRRASARARGPAA